jgi:hypothetical protein
MTNFTLSLKCTSTKEFSQQNSPNSNSPQVCPSCGSLISPTPRRYQGTSASGNNKGFKVHTNIALALSLEQICYPCTEKARKKDPYAQDVECEEVEVPFVFRVLNVELAAMGVRLNLKLNKPRHDAYWDREDILRGQELTKTNLDEQEIRFEMEREKDRQQIKKAFIGQKDKNMIDIQRFKTEDELKWINNDENITREICKKEKRRRRKVKVMREGDGMRTPSKKEKKDEKDDDKSKSSSSKKSPNKFDRNRWLSDSETTESETGPNYVRGGAETSTDSDSSCGKSKYVHTGPMPIQKRRKIAAAEKKMSILNPDGTRTYLDQNSDEEKNGKKNDSADVSTSPGSKGSKSDDNSTSSSSSSERSDSNDEDFSDFFSDDSYAKKVKAIPQERIEHGWQVGSENWFNIERKKKEKDIKHRRREKKRARKKELREAGKKADDIDNILRKEERKGDFEVTSESEVAEVSSGVTSGSDSEADAAGEMKKAAKANAAKQPKSKNTPKSNLSFRQELLLKKTPTRIPRAFDDRPGLIHYDFDKIALRKGENYDQMEERLKKEEEDEERRKKEEEELQEERRIEEQELKEFLAVLRKDLPDMPEEGVEDGGSSSENGE